MVTHTFVERWVTDRTGNRTAVAISCYKTSYGSTSHWIPVTYNTTSRSFNCIRTSFVTHTRSHTTRRREYFPLKKTTKNKYPYLSLDKWSRYRCIVRGFWQQYKIIYMFGSVSCILNPDKNPFRTLSGGNKGHYLDQKRDRFVWFIRLTGLYRCR